MPILTAAHGALSTIFSNLFISLPYPKGNLEGQTIVVTGANTGLGLESSRHLVRLGAAKLIMGVRNLEKGEQAKKDILSTTKRDGSCIEIWQVDMDNYHSVQTFARCLMELPRVDALLANAGIYAFSYTTSEENERTITVNVVSTILLCMLILPKLRQTAEQFQITPRIVIPNSALHYLSSTKELDGDIFVNLNDPKTANMMTRYNLSKLLIIFAIRELANRVKYTTINTPNPSYCKSGLVAEAGFGAKVGEKLLARSTEAGSRAFVHAILSGPESNGHYLTNCHIQAPSSIVTNAKGSEWQKDFFSQLMKKLEIISPGILQNI